MSASGNAAHATPRTLRRVSVRALALSLAAALLVSGYPLARAQAAAAIRYVTPSGSGDCSTWATACSLQTALTGAASGDEIWVQQGTYAPTTGTDRTATFSLKGGVGVYGGFVGNEATRDARNWRRTRRPSAARSAPRARPTTATTS